MFMVRYTRLGKPNAARTVAVRNEFARRAAIVRRNVLPQQINKSKEQLTTTVKKLLENSFFAGVVFLFKRN
jgi:hypothetical protein